MANEFQKLSGDYERTGKEAFSSMMQSAGDFRKSLRGMSLEMAEFSRRSINRAIEAQAELTKNAFDAYISELSKFATLGLYGSFFARNEGAEAKQGIKKRGTATAGRKSVQNRNNKKASSGRSLQRTAAQRTSTQRKTGRAKGRARKA